VTTGGSRHDLARLAALVRRTGAAELWVLCDLLHGDPGPARWRSAWERFRAELPALRIVVLAGNHDRALHGAALGVRIEDAARRDGPFEFRHEPRLGTGMHVVCGHLHPVLRLPTLRRPFPAFALAPGTTVLPAFSLFTGGWPVDPQAERIVACVDGALVDAG
jgi:hypothetical protein